MTISGETIGCSANIDDCKKTSFGPRALSEFEMSIASSPGLRCRLESRVPSALVAELRATPTSDGQGNEGKVLPRSSFLEEENLRFAEVRLRCEVAHPPRMKIPYQPRWFRR